MDRFENYDIEDEIGRGGMGIVYRARDRSDGKMVALKLLKGLEVPDKTRQHLIKREIRSLKILKHPNIIEVYDVDCEEDPPRFFTMALVEGGGLMGRKQEFRGDYTAVAKLVGKVCRAVDFAHENNIIHRDLNPKNILIDKNHNPFVADFGLARALDGRDVITTRSLRGTPMYLSPEQTVPRPELICRQTDVFGLGTILYEMITGRAPFQLDTQENQEDRLDVILRLIKEEDPVPPSFFDSLVPPDLEMICMKSLQKLPSQRYETAMLMAIDLEMWLMGVDPSCVKEIENDAVALYYEIRKLQVGRLDLAKLMAMEWIIVAALNNGVFQGNPVSKSSKRLGFLHEHPSFRETSEMAVCDLLIDAKIFSEVDPGHYCLNDIDEYVLPGLGVLFSLDVVSLARRRPDLRRRLKALAKEKAVKSAWSMQGAMEVILPAQMSFATTKNQMETAHVLESVGEDGLRVVSEYGTWMRRIPNQDCIEKLVERGTILRVILASPPPPFSEGYTEWAESLLMLMAWGAEIYVMDRDAHEHHMTVGEVALSFHRDRTSGNLQKHPLCTEKAEVDRLKREFDSLVRHRKTWSLEAYLGDNPLQFNVGDFDVLVGCECGEADMHVAWDPIYGRKPLDAASESLIAEAWERAEREADEEGRQLFPGRLCRLDDYKEPFQNKLANFPQPS